MADRPGLIIQRGSEGIDRSCLSHFDQRPGSLLADTVICVTESGAKGINCSRISHLAEHHGCLPANIRIPIARHIYQGFD
jgi:hypothetical protein